MLSTIRPTFFDRQLSRAFRNTPSMMFRDPFYDMHHWDPLLDLNLNDPFFDSSLDMMRPTMLDFFDPFNSMDRLMGRNLRWLNEPSVLPSRLMAPFVPQKYRITLDCSGFSENSIKTNISGNKLEIKAVEGNPELKDTDNYTVREMRRTYNLPDYVDKEKMVSFMTNNGLLVVEFPWKDQTGLSGMNVFPSIDEANKKVTMDVLIPENIDPTKIHVTCKDNDLIVKADYRLKNDDGSTRSKIHYLRRTTLPENTNWDTLKCESDNTKLHISADLNPNHNNNSRTIPITYLGEKSSLL